MNVVLYCLSKAKGSAAYNQQVTTNIIYIDKNGELPNDSRCEPFLDRKRIPSGNTAGFPDLPEDKLSQWESIQLLYVQVKRWC